MIELKNKLNDWGDYITTYKPYNPSDWSQIPTLVTYCINYRYTEFFLLILNKNFVSMQQFVAIVLCKCVVNIRIF